MDNSLIKSFANFVSTYVLWSLGLRLGSCVGFSFRILGLISPVLILTKSLAPFKTAIPNSIPTSALNVPIFRFQSFFGGSS
jgi:hypothetical protein